MYGKTPISALQEYCAKKNLPSPVYEVDESTEDGVKVFICMVEAVDEMAEGSGRSKKEAKHDAATNLLKKLKFSHPDVEDIPQAEHGTLPISDAIADLRDLCLERDHPFPIFEVVQQDGPPEAPEFNVSCSVATVKRFGKASTKKGAKQLAAKQLIDIIKNMPVDNDSRELVTFEKSLEQEETKKNRKAKTYREFIESGQSIPPGTKICDRHNYFKHYDPEKRAKALKVLANDSFFSKKEKVLSILSELEITYKTSEIQGKKSLLTFIELNCELDVVFANTIDQIYQDMLEYFEIMLK